MKCWRREGCTRGRRTLFELETQASERLKAAYRCRKLGHRSGTPLLSVEPLFIDFLLVLIQLQPTATPGLRTIATHWVPFWWVRIWNLVDFLGGARTCRGPYLVWLSKREKLDDARCWKYSLSTPERDRAERALAGHTCTKEKRRRLRRSCERSPRFKLHQWIKAKLLNRSATKDSESRVWLSG